MVFTTVTDSGGEFWCWNQSWLSLWGLRIEDGSRIFLGGENLWSGGQKRAILCLLSYADNRSDQDLQCFQAEIDVVQGDMEARVELDSRRNSYPIIVQGFIRGRNRPGDIPTAITFYRMAAWNNEISRAILDWRGSDEYILRLVAIAAELRNSKSQAQAQRLRSLAHLASLTGPRIQPGGSIWRVFFN